MFLLLGQQDRANEVFDRLDFTFAGVEALAARLGLRRDGVPDDDAEMLQAVWWVKVLRDDPLRVLRALRL
mgnify:CR=1 FL=1